ncbi:hypothetical protein [Lysobacter sp. GCM10012299]|uniref:hypothetical protein n=1 Tax=Lysobacter sp. GCM10012299 TaxID=3317333 RepID=UPI00360BAD2B
MDRFRENLVLLALTAGITLAVHPVSAAETDPKQPETTRAYAACAVMDEVNKTLYATAPGRIDALTRPVTLDAQAFSTWVARVYNVPDGRLSSATCVTDYSSKRTAELRLKPFVDAGRRQGLAVERTRWWLSQ